MTCAAAVPCLFFLSVGITLLLVHRIRESPGLENTSCASWHVILSCAFFIRVFRSLEADSSKAAVVLHAQPLRCQRDWASSLSSAQVPWNSPLLVTAVQLCELEKSLAWIYLWHIWIQPRPSWLSGFLAKSLFPSVSILTKWAFPIQIFWSHWNVSVQYFFCNVIFWKWVRSCKRFESFLKCVFNWKMQHE